jgi:two-component sensor histidine kinase
VAFRIVESLRPIRNKPWLGYSVGVLIFAAGFLLRYLPGGFLENVPFITLFPAILVAALIGGVRVGFLVAVLSFMAGWYFFLPPYNSWSLDSSKSLWALLLFWVVVGIQLYVIESLNRAVDRLSEERDRVDTLFRELQHRVANNMMFVASLLRLQRKAIEANPERGSSILEQAQGRLETMARIHRRLYDPEIVNLPLTTYLQGLAKDILDAAGAQNIVCVVEVLPVKLELPRLVTLSLLINELITNSLKHGFAGREGGTISVKLEREAERLLVLSIRDDGRGFVGDIPKEGSLGMTIIRSLATQLGGEVTWASASGTTARVAFPA